jgi:hypothetical protein
MWMLGLVVLALVTLSYLVRDTEHRRDASRDRRDPSVRVLESARLEAHERIVVPPSKEPADLPPPGLPSWSPPLLAGFSRELPTPHSE